MVITGTIISIVSAIIGLAGSLGITEIITNKQLTEAAENTKLGAELSKKLSNLLNIAKSKSSTIYNKLANKIAELINVAPYIRSPELADYLAEARKSNASKLKEVETKINQAEQLTNQSEAESNYYNSLTRGQKNSKEGLTAYNDAISYAKEAKSIYDSLEGTNKNHNNIEEII